MESLISPSAEDYLEDYLEDQDISLQGEKKWHCLINNFKKLYIFSLQIHIIVQFLSCFETENPPGSQQYFPPPPPPVDELVLCDYCKFLAWSRG